MTITAKSFLHIDFLAAAGAATYAAVVAGVPALAYLSEVFATPQAAAALAGAAAIRWMAAHRSGAS